MNDKFVYLENKNKLKLKRHSKIIINITDLNSDIMCKLKRFS